LYFCAQLGRLARVRTQHIQAMVAGNHEQPGRELRLFLERVQLLIRSGEDFLRQVSGGFAVGGEAQTPASHSRVVPAKQLVYVLITRVIVRASPVFCDQLLVRDVVEEHLIDYSNQGVAPFRRNRASAVQPLQSSKRARNLYQSTHKL